MCRGKAVFYRHHDVEDAEIKLLFFEIVYRFLPVDTECGGIPFGIQVILQEVAQVWSSSASSTFRVFFSIC